MSDLEPTAELLEAARDIVESRDPMILACPAGAHVEWAGLRNRLRVALERNDLEDVTAVSREIVEGPHPKIISCPHDSLFRWQRMEKRLKEALAAEQDE